MSIETYQQTVSEHSSVSQETHHTGREEMASWREALTNSPLSMNPYFQHSLDFYFADQTGKIKEIEQTSSKIPELEGLVGENDFRGNLPRLERYDGIGNRIEEVVHHPSYLDAGDIIYGTSMMKKMSRAGGLLESLMHFYLTSHAGEAGHNCPVACTAGIIRVLSLLPEVDGQKEMLEKLTAPGFRQNFTGAQFLTEIQGGSDVGRNATKATQDENGNWRIVGEKWFCSNVHAELILMTARYDQEQKGTRGLGLFLVKRHKEDGEINHFTIRRLKEKLGTRTMASGEIDFRGSFAIHMGPLEGGFKMVMENVLHLSRIYNTFSVTGMGRRSYQIAALYAKNRKAFGMPITNYPLVMENLAQIHVENCALLSGGMHLTALQDQHDEKMVSGKEISQEEKLLLRLLANLNKYISAYWSVEHIHHSIDVLAGNGAIESFSSLPRMFRDSIVCENWEGTHNTLRMQVLRDILRYSQDEIFVKDCERFLGELGELSHNDLIKQALESWKTTVAELKSAEQAVQTLLIRDVLDEMSKIYLALCVAKEAKDQGENGMKSRVLDYFLDLHFRGGVPKSMEGIQKMQTVCGESL